MARKWYFGLAQQARNFFSNKEVLVSVSFPETGIYAVSRLSSEFPAGNGLMSNESPAADSAIGQAVLAVESRFA